MNGWLVRARTVLALGAGSVGRVLWYRAALRAGVHPAQRLPAITVSGDRFFVAPAAADPELRAPAMWRAGARYFGWFDVAGPGAPDWFRNPFTGARVRNPDAPWHTFSDFDPQLGDIKAIWEVSRFDWVMALAQQARGGDPTAVPRLNAWLADWFAHNPPYCGPNWMCGQEASIRLLHVAIAALILGQAETPSPTLVAFVVAHVRRIAPTMSYARAQNNNHGTSEAAALFVGGTWLARAGHPDGAAMARLGRAALEERGLALILPDGTFSQYSVNYHRVMLDTYCMAEVWRARLGEAPFSSALHQRLATATSWLVGVIDRQSGDAPNLGHNDGANLLPLTDADGRDFRPAAHLAAALFSDTSAFPETEDARRTLDWLGVQARSTVMAPTVSQRFDDGGIAVLRNGVAMAVLRYPRHRFRPGHADALHLDFWLAGVNLLRDGGTFSYADDRAMNYYPTVAAHNTVQFDDRDQMPRLGRFLYGGWLQTASATPIGRDGDAATMSAAYRDAHGVFHQRSIRLEPSSLTITDRVEGFSKRAVLRWRLAPGPWKMDGATVTDGTRSLSVTSTSPLVRCELVPGRESRYYMKESAIPVMEVEIARPGNMSTIVRSA
jgi:hypothetical protein